MTEPLLALCDGSLLALAGRMKLIETARVQTDRAMRGALARSVFEDDVLGLGTLAHRRSFTFHGPNGGRALVVRMLVGPDDRPDARTSLELAARALDAMLHPAWTPEEKTHVHSVALACALAAADARPDCAMWAGFAAGPTGPARAEAMIENRASVAQRLWHRTDALEGRTVPPTTPSVTIGIEKPRDHGRVPHAVTISQTRRTLTRDGLAAMDAIARLRLHALIGRNP